MGKIKDKELYKKINERKKQNELVVKIFSYFLLSFGGLVMLVPFFWMVITSFKEKGAVLTYPPEWVPRSYYNVVHNDREYRIYEGIINNKKQKFIELEYKNVSKPIIYSETKVIKKEYHVVGKIKLLENVNLFGRTAKIDVKHLEKTEEVDTFLDKNYVVYRLKEKVGKYPKGLKGLLIEKEVREYKIFPKIYLIKKNIGATYEMRINGKILKVSRISHPIINKGEPSLVTVVREIDYKPGKTEATILPVKDSKKIRASIQYFDEELEDLTSRDEFISFNKEELKKVDMSSYEDLELDVSQLFYLKSEPNRKFAVFDKSAMGYEPVSSPPIFGVQKYNQIKSKTKTSDGKEIEVYKNVPKFTAPKYVNFLFKNYSSALFKALPPVKGSDIKGFSILSVLLSVFDSIPAFVVYFINSLTIALCVTFANIATSCLAAYAFARLNWKGRDKIFFLYLSTMMIPGQVTMIPVFIVTDQLGWLNTYKSLILPQAFGAWSVFLLRQFFLSIPASLEEAAFLDGATKAGILFRIILPLSKAALGTLFIFRFQEAYNDFLWPLIVTKSDYMKVIQIGLASFQDLHGTDWTLLMAASVIVVMPVLVIFILNQKHISEGIKLGGIKG